MPSPDHHGRGEREEGVSRAREQPEGEVEFAGLGGEGEAVAQQALGLVLARAAGEQGGEPEPRETKTARHGRGNKKWCGHGSLSGK